MSNTPSRRFKLKAVRISFPSLATTELYGGKDTGKYAITCLLPKSDTETKALIDEIIAEERAKKPNVKIPKNNVFVTDGDDAEFEEYHGHWILKLATRKIPTVIDRDKTPIRDLTSIKGGDYCNVIGSVWIQDNEHGKRANGNLWGVQFVRSGEPFGETVDVSAEFDEEDEEDF